MSLSTYKKKRDFRQTKEPAGGKAPAGEAPLKFVVQRHDATRLHYDFRLEMDGVLKSWAVPKGPSMNPADKRLAMMVEDHPFSYRTFEGVIPEGNYGAGIVELWDEGTYECLGIPDKKEGEKALLKALKSGSVKVVLKGRKLKGEFALVRMKTADSNNAWLLLKHDDKFAVHKDYDSETLTPKSSPINKARAQKKNSDKKETAAKTRRQAKPATSPEPAAPLRAAKKTTERPGVKRAILKNAAPPARVAISNPDKVYWPAAGITKAALINYYQQVSNFILPHLKNRPQSLHRFPDGVKSDGFYQKNVDSGLPGWAKTETLYSEAADKDIRYLICNDRSTLALLNNLGCIELNPWNSRLKSLDRPDYMVIDIDPSDGNTFDQVIDTALTVKAVLDKAGAEAYCKTSGATGLHVYVPLNARFDYDVVRKFAEVVASLAREQLPDFTTLERSLKKRKRSEIYIDYLQNKRGQTLASAYSIRPVKDATVSAPLRWKEVKYGLSPAQFTLETMPKRLARTGDLFAPVLGKGADLLACIRRLGA